VTNEVPADARGLLRHPAGWIGTGFGSGLVPRAPGTAGSLAALLPWWFGLRPLDPAWYLAAVAAAFVVGVWSANWVIARTRIADPSVFVWDEFVGLWLALFLAPAGWAWVLAGFVLFRVFDIWKPWPVRWADRRLHGGFGAMLDDVFAGLYAALTLQAIALIPHITEHGALA
jgi:phosphatidylglycerophosphatase A